MYVSYPYLAIAKSGISLKLYFLCKNKSIPVGSEYSPIIFLNSVVYF